MKLLSRIALVACLTAVPSVGAVSSAAARTVSDDRQFVAAAADGPTFRTLSFNICGARSTDRCPNGGGPEVAHEAADRILNRMPLSAALQEVCENQAGVIRNRLDGRGYRTWFIPTRPGGAGCPGDARFGNTLVYKGEHVWRVTHDLPNPEGHEARKLACAMLNTPRVLACVTHIDFHAGTRGVQIRAVADFLHQRAAAGHAAYVGGDFNAPPTYDALDAMYAPAFGGGSHGEHTEGNGCCNRGGPATHDGGSKIDYVFANIGHFRANWGDPVPSGRSDHHAYWVSLTMR